MKLEFFKYQGTGNDFIMIDNRQKIFSQEDTKLIGELCDRRFGIGADGLILIENHSGCDFKMIYFNSDGSQSLCGNGGRCAVAFAKYLGIIESKATFEAIDGLHYATIDEDYVKLQMHDVSSVKKISDDLFLDTGSPHHIKMTDSLKSLDVKTEGAKIRYSDRYGESGTNVNFVSKDSTDTFSIRTYERGVEDETLSCGTGVTAVATAATAAAEPPLDPPGTRERSHGFLVILIPEFSVDDPMANSSRFNLPKSTKPDFFNNSKTVAS